MKHGPRTGRRPLGLLVALLSFGMMIGWTTAVAWAEEETDVVARVVGVAGEVTVESSGVTKKVGIGYALKKGDRLVTGSRASATLITAEDQKVTVHENSKVRVDRKLHAETGRQPSGGGLMKGLFGFVANKFKSSKEASTLMGNVAPLRGPEQEPTPVLLSPRNTWVLQLRPTLLWQGTPGAKEYSVRLRSADGNKWEVRVRAPLGGDGTAQHQPIALPYPKEFPDLAAGVYRWTDVEHRSDGRRGLGGGPGA